MVGKLGAFNTVTGGKDAHSLFQPSDAVAASEDFPLKFLGAACTSLDGTNPCTVVGVASNNKWDDVMYMTNTRSKFTYNPDTNDDGVANYPTSASGSVTLTNGGRQSIMIVSTAKNKTGTQSYARAGGNMISSKRIYRIDRQIGATASQTLTTAMTYAFGNSYTQPGLLDCQPASTAFGGLHGEDPFQTLQFVQA